jgi:hypothetical protein
MRRDTNGQKIQKEEVWPEDENKEEEIHPNNRRRRGPVRRRRPFTHLERVMIKQR